MPSTPASSSQQSTHCSLLSPCHKGFAARLTAEEGKAMEMNDESASVTPEMILPLHTTRSPSFLGLSSSSQGMGLWNVSDFGKGVIIGALDTGIQPPPSFFQ